MLQREFTALDFFHNVFDALDGNRVFILNEFNKIYYKLIVNPNFKSTYFVEKELSELLSENKTDESFLSNYKIKVFYNDLFIFFIFYGKQTSFLIKEIQSESITMSICEDENRKPSLDYLFLNVNYSRCNEKKKQFILEVLSCL